MRPLAKAKTFPLIGSALDAFVLLKSELLESSLQSIEKPLPFVIDCDASVVAISANLNQDGRPLAFMSRTLQGSEKYYPLRRKRQLPLFVITTDIYPNCGLAFCSFYAG